MSTQHMADAYDAAQIRQAMSWLGSQKSAAKSAASRANGKKGGRPKKSRKEKS